MLSFALWLPMAIAAGAIAGFYVGPVGLTASLVCWLLLALAIAIRYVVAPIRWRARPMAALLAALVAILFHGFALAQSRLPRGIDAAFHCTVTLNFLINGRVTDHLRPLEQVPLNYPTGIHALAAMATHAAHLKGMPLAPHETFRWSYVVPLVGLALLSPLFACQPPGLLAPWVALFGFVQLTWYPYTWGGLPTLLACWLFLAGLAALGRSHWFEAGWLWGAAALCHHHVGVAVLGGLLALAVLSKDRPPHLVHVLAVATLISSGYWIRLVGRLTTLPSTGLLGYVEPFEWPWEVLWAAGPFAWIGIAAAVAAWRHGPSAPHRVALRLAALWTTAFLILAYIVRPVTEQLGRPVSLFTPSRFLVEAQAALLPSVALMLDRALGARRWLATMVTIVMVAMCVVWTWERWTGAPLGQLPAWIASGDWRAVSGTLVGEDRLLEPGAYVDRHAPAKAVVLGPPGLVWLTYTTRRESTGLFLPISEPVTRAVRIKHELSRAPTKRPWQEWKRQLGGRPLWAVYPLSVPLPGERVRAVFGGAKVSELP